MPTEIRVRRRNLAYPIAEPSGKKAVNMVAFGDSITAGTGASDAAHRWANIVAASLGATLTNSGISATILQNTVQNSVDTIGAAADNNGRDTYTARITGYSPKYVYILYGLNDLRLNDVAITQALFEADLTEIVTALITAGITASDIVLGSPPYTDPAQDGANSPFDGGTTSKHQLYTASVQNIAAIKGTKYADIYGAMVAGGGNDLLAVDGIHPNDTGHALIASTFLAATTTTAKWYLAGSVSAANCLAAYEAKGAASLAASYVNKINAGTNNLVLSGDAPGWDSTNGWDFPGDSATTYLKTSIVPVEGYSFLVRFAGGTTADEYVCGAYSTRGLGLLNKSAGNTVQYWSGTYAFRSPGVASGTLGISGNQPYRNGEVDGDVLAAWGGTITEGFDIGKLGGFATNRFGGTIQAVAIYKATLSTAQMLAITTAMAAL